MMENKIITLDNNEQYFILTKEKIEENTFLIGIKIENDKYLNEFKIFLEETKNDKTNLTILDDEDLIKVIINAYLLERI